MNNKTAPLKAQDHEEMMRRLREQRERQELLYSIELGDTPPASSPAAPTPSHTETETSFSMGDG